MDLKFQRDKSKSWQRRVAAGGRHGSRNRTWEVASLTADTSRGSDLELVEGFKLSQPPSRDKLHPGRLCLP